MSKQTRFPNQEVYNERKEQRRCPRGYGVSGYRQARVLTVCLDGFCRQEHEDPDAGADDRRVGSKDVKLEEGVDSAWKVAESACEEEETDYGAVLGFEALEERNQGDSVEEEVEEVLVDEREGVEAIH